MFWFIMFLTVLLVIDCLFLILLVLVQLPKKEAGLGQAFGSGTTDALFGAGSGNALTKLTKYFTAGFFILTLSLSILNAQQSKSKRSGLERALEKAAASDVATPPAPAATTTPASTTPVVPLTGTNGLTTQPNAATAVPNATTNVPAPSAPADKK
jgi:preprotein translocase subunit SecG